MSKAKKILSLLSQGKSIKEVAKATKSSKSYVYWVRWDANKNAKPTSESRKKVFNITMPKIKAEVRDVKAAMDFLDASKITTRPFTKAEIKALDAGTPDRVDHPPHYTAGGIETIDFIEAKDLNYRLGNVIKYVSRAEKKENPLEDLKKAKWYLEREISTRERA